MTALVLMRVLIAGRCASADVRKTGLQRAGEASAGSFRAIGRLATWLFSLSAKNPPRKPSRGRGEADDGA